MKTTLRIMTATLLLGAVACNSKPPAPTKVATTTSTRTYQSSGK